MAADPDHDTRIETASLLAGDAVELEARFSGRLQFGTAGLRGPLGAGPNRMNRLLVRQAAAGVGRYLLAAGPGTNLATPALGAGSVTGAGSASPEPLVVVGYDARHKSEVFALDTVRVLCAMGVRAALLPRPFPTPVLAYAVGALGAAAGVMVTASHNPPTDNGYKVFLADGSQIVDPIDRYIAAEIDKIDPVDVELGELDHPNLVRLDDAVLHRYLAMAGGARLRPDLQRQIKVVYTPLHGVGGETLLAAFSAAGLAAPRLVPSQADPDPEFPTVSFPNPEEPGTLDSLLQVATEADADLALANDPDADRLGVAIPTPDGGWRVLRGDEIGWLLADHILTHTHGSDRLVVTTLVSSSLLGKMATAAGIHYVETFTGFKWIAAQRRVHRDLRFVFGYEQALGYLVTDCPADKDGITAAIMMTEVAALAAAEGLTLLDRLSAIEARFGRHQVAERAIALEPAEGARRVAALRSWPPTVLAGMAVTEVVDFPEANLIRLNCGPHARVQARPSGTEPKVKLYAETVGTAPEPLLDALAELLAAG